MQSVRSKVAAGIFALGTILPVTAFTQTDVPIFKIVDFNGTEVRSTLGAYGGHFADNGELANDSVTYGNSLLTTFLSHEDPDSMLWVPGRNDSSGTAMQLGYQLGTVQLGCGGICTYPPHVGVSFNFAGEALDLTGATHITFWAKARDTARVEVSVGTRDTIPNLPGFSQKFTIDTAWKKYSIELKVSADFKLPSWTPDRPFNVADVNAISFGISKADNPDSTGNALFLDDIEIVNWQYTLAVGIRPQARNDFRKAKDMEVRRAGRLAYVKLPAEYSGRTGTLEAWNAAGKMVGRAAFGPQVSEVVVKLEASAAAANQAGLYFRARTR